MVVVVIGLVWFWFGFLESEWGKKEKVSRKRKNLPLFSLSSLCLFLSFSYFS